MSRLPASLIFLLVVAVAPATAQLAGPITGTEIFITHDWGFAGITTGTTGWDNITVVDGGGTPYTLTFTNQTTTSTGFYGPIVTDGPYQIEALWLINTGVTGGHFHPILTGGNPGTYEGTHGNGAMQNQGVRIFRTDGAPLTLQSIDYMNVLEPFLIGTSFSTYTDLLTWTRIGTAEGVMFTQAAWNTFTFVPPDIEAIHVDPTTSFVSFNSSNGTFSIATTVSGYSTVGGFLITDPVSDPVIGATLMVFGNYIGPDVNSLSNMFLIGVSTSIVVSPGSDQLTTVNQFLQTLGAGDATVFGGPNGATPTTWRSLGQNGPGVITRLGSGSGVLDNLNTNLPSSPLNLVFALEAGGPILRSIVRNYVPPVNPPEMRFRTNGFGSAQIGMIGLTPFAEIWNIPVISPANPTVGSGSFFGVTLGGTQLEILALPMGVKPFHVMTDMNGVYFYGVPTGTIAAGLVIDLVTIEIPAGATSVGFVSPVERVTF